MTLSGTFRVATESFPLSTTLDATPDAKIRFVRVAITSEVLSPYFWATSADLGALADALDADPSVASTTQLDTVDENALYRVLWADDAVEAAAAYDPAGVSVLDTFGTEEGWFLRIRFADREALTTFRTALREEGVRFTTLSLTSTEVPDTGAPYGLTPKQTDAVLAALEAGYFDTPRRVTLAEIAPELGISQQALSDRLHRAIDTLIRHTVGLPTHVEASELEDRI
jgi:predicted DNA binding protein